MADAQEKVEFRWKPNPKLQDAQDWIQEWTQNHIEDAEIDIDTQASQDYSNHPKATIVKIVQEMERNKDMMAAILEHSGCSRDDSAKAVRNIISDISFYAEDHWDFFKDEDYYQLADPVSFWVESVGIPTIGRILGPAMRRGSKLILLGLDEVSFFWGYLIKILMDCGVPLATEAFDKCSSTQFQCGGELFDGISCPMIVFEASDVFAAVRTLVQSAWEFNSKTYWTPTHVYVQESVFDIFLGLLKTDAINHLELMGVQVIQKEATASEGHPAIFQPCESLRFRFFLGWDPKALGSEAEYDEGITVLSFRTADEGISAANSLPDAFCASLWTEKLKFGPQTAARLKMNTVWINCHGVLDPYTSFGSDSKFVPLNGPHLLEMLMAISQPKTKPASLPKKFGSDSRYHVPSYQEAEALEQVKSLPLMNDTERISFLRPLKEQLASVGMRNGLDWARRPEFAYRLSDSGVEITSRRLPGIPQYVDLHLPTAELEEKSLAFLAYFLVSRGRPLVWTSGSDTVEHTVLKPLCDKNFIVRIPCVSKRFERRDVLVVHTSTYKEVAAQSKDATAVAIAWDNLALIPHFSHFLTPTKNVFVG